MAKKKGSRSRKPKQASETQADRVETRTASGTTAQMKLPEPSKLEHHLSNCEAWESKFADLKKKVKAAYDAAAIDRVPKGLIKELMGLKTGDPIQARHRLESLGIGLKVIGAPYQLNVFDTMFENDVEQAKAEGAMAGRAGKPPECRFAEGSPAHDAFLEAYRFAQANRVPGADTLSKDEIQGALKESAEKTEAPKKDGAKLELVH